MKNRVFPSIPKVQSWFPNVVLVAAIGLQLGLYLNKSGGYQLFNISAMAEERLHLTSLVCMIGVVLSRLINHGRLVRQAEAGREQLDALLGMFRGVKHKLNNDMQVVLGNAELAEILINTGGDTTRPVQNITAAANDAVERIEQLSVFGSTCFTNPGPVDLNSVLRETMAKLSEELPLEVALRLELEHLSARVITDRYLLSLSLTYLIRLAVVNMRYGGEVIIRTSQSEKIGPAGAPDSVVASVRFVQANDHRAESKKTTDPVGQQQGFKTLHAVDSCANGLDTAKALIERAGVKSVVCSREGHDPLVTLCFDTNLESERRMHADSLVSQQYS